MGLLTLQPLGMAGAEQRDVFVRNQHVEVDRTTGDVSIIHFFRLLEEAEREQLRLEGRKLFVTDEAGVSHLFNLNESRRLDKWEDALKLLGYVRRVNSETGVVDYHLASVEEPRESDEVVLESEAVRLERSLRRPGYLKAQTNYEKVIQQIPLSSDEQSRQRVERIGQLIAARSPLSGLMWNFDVIRSPIPNALCTGEGHVLITEGLLDLNLTDDELAGVLGHEVAHGVRRHAEIYEERFAEYLKIRSDILALSYEYNKADEEKDRYKIQRLETKVKDRKKRYDFILDYLKKKRDYDQDEEEEADVLGMQYAAAAGFDPLGEARALTKLKKRSVELFGSSYDSGSRTHPPLERRLQILKTVQQRWRSQ